MTKLKGKSIENFINEYIKEIDNIDDLLKLCNNDCSLIGFIGELLFDLCIKFGISDFGNINIKHYSGKFEDHICEMKNINDYIKLSAISGNRTGKSDCHFSIGKNMYLTTSKFGQVKNDLTKFDISDIKDCENFDKNCKIILFIKDKNLIDDELEKVQIKTKNWFNKSIDKNLIFDINDLSKWYLRLRNLFKKYDYDFDRINNEWLFKNRDILYPRLHQRIICNNIFITLKQSHNKKFLIGAIPRSGKSFMMAYIIHLYTDYLSQFNNKGNNYLIITTRPSETIEGYKEIFDKYIEFQNFKIFNSQEDKFKNIDYDNDNNIIICSKQYLEDKGYLKTKKKKNKSKKGKYNSINVDKLKCIFTDEFHMGGCSENSFRMINHFTKKPIINMTGTFNKVLYQYKIKDENCYYWDLVDIKNCKDGNFDKLKFDPIDIQKGLKYLHNLGHSNKDVQNEYKKFPNFNLLTLDMDSNLKNKLNKVLSGSDGFDMRKLFALDKHKNLKNDYEVSLFMEHFFGNFEKNIEYNNSKYINNSIIKRIRNYSKDISCNTLKKGNTNVILMFLPCGTTGQKLSDLQKALKKLILTIPIVKSNFDIENISSDMKTESKKLSILGKVRKWIDKSKKNGKHLIILAGQMLSLGISIPEINITVLFNHYKSSDLILQMMFRSGTENKGKKLAWVVDYNINRCLNCLMDYADKMFPNERDIKTKLRLITDIIGINPDKLVENETKDVMINKLYNLWRKQPKNLLERVFKNCFNTLRWELEREDIYKILRFGLNCTKNNLKVMENINEKDKLKEGDIYEEDSDAEIDNKQNSSDSEDFIESDDEEEELDLDFEDICKKLVTLTLIIHFKDSETDIVKLLQNLYKTDEIFELCKQQLDDWFGLDKNNWTIRSKKDLQNFIELIIKLMNKYLDKNDNIYHMSSYFRDEYKSLIDREEDLLNYINKFLTPSEREKKQKGEVFTPLSLVKEMLDKLPKKVWYNPNLKWLDPANGMGNYPIIIYQKLMKTLVKDFPNKEDRKQHILEKMIYIGELSTKNCFIFRNVLDPNGIYNLNIFCGDSLSNDFDEHMKNEWKIDNFDIVVGNPPYQSFDKEKKKIKRGGSNNLYEKFIEKYINFINKNGYFTFVTPSSWFSISKKNQKLRKILFSYKLIHINIHVVNKHFSNVGNNFCYFLLQTNKNLGNLINIECLYNKKEYKSKINQNILPNEFIPLLLHKNSINIINKILYNKKYEKKYNAKLRYEYEPRKKHIYQIKPNNNKQYWKVKSTKDRILYTDKHTNLIGKEKIIIPTTKYYDKMEITNLVTTQSFINILFDKNDCLEYHFKFLKNKIYKFINNICRWGNWNYPEVIALFPKIEKIDLSDENIYKYFNLTDDEIKIIEENVKDKKSKKLSKNVDEEKTDNNDKNESNNSNSLYTEKELKKKKYTLSKLQEIAKDLNIPTQIPKTGKNKGMKNRGKKDLIEDILDRDIKKEEEIIPKKEEEEIIPKKEENKKIKLKRKKPPKNINYNK